MNTEAEHDEIHHPEEPRPWKFNFWHAAGLMFLLGILQAFMFLAVSRASGVEVQDMAWWHFALISGISGGVTAWAGAVLTGFSISHNLTAGSIQANEIFSGILTILGASILTSELNNVLQWIAPMSDEFNMSGKLMQESLVGVLITVGIAAPLTEELIFRGVILDGLRENHRVQTAVLVSSFLFALIHVHPWMMINAFILGLLFAVIRLRTGSLVLCMLIHCIYNVLPFLLTRVFSVEIPGFTAVSETVQFQPLWFDALGVLLAGAGLAGLRFTSTPEPSA